MRTIKFRGKHKVYSNIPQEWVFGHLFSTSEKGDFAIHWWDNGFYKRVSVWEETIGQFTGMTDKDGREIYEGDIILVADVGTFYVRYNEERCQFELCDFHHSFKDILWELNKYRYKIVGNIYDDDDFFTNA